MNRDFWKAATAPGELSHNFYLRTSYNSFTTKHFPVLLRPLAATIWEKADIWDHISRCLYHRWELSYQRGHSFIHSVSQSFSQSFSQSVSQSVSHSVIQPKIFLQLFTNPTEKWLASFRLFTLIERIAKTIHYTYHALSLLSEANCNNGCQYMHANWSCSIWTYFCNSTE